VLKLQVSLRERLKLFVVNLIHGKSVLSITV